MPLPSDYHISPFTTRLTQETSKGLSLPCRHRIIEQKEDNDNDKDENNDNDKDENKYNDKDEDKYKDKENNDISNNFRLKREYSSISLWIERWFLSSNAKDIGTCATRAFILVLFVVWYANSDITGVIFINNMTYPPYITGLIIANNIINVIAGDESRSEIVLPQSNSSIKGIWQGYDKKLDTHGSPWVRPFVLSRILRRMSSKTKATIKSTDYSGSLKAAGHSSEESNIVTYVQEPKSDRSISLKDKNNKVRVLSDPSASTCKRGRSPHSSPVQKIPTSSVTRGGSVKASIKKQGSRSMANSQNLRMLVQSKLTSYRNKDDKYNGIIRILADVSFLQFCYMLIKGKPGNMNKGTTKETLDGISYQWFVKLAEELLTGKFQFTPARRIIIPKPGKKKGRPLAVVAPREKIVQKGLQVILEAIYEPKFLDCSHGFRPNRSTHSALKMLYLKAHHHSWVIQGDISKCFDMIPHQSIMNRLNREITCDRTLSLVKKALIIGYLNPRTKQITKSNIGIPQGSVLSPLLANIVLHELDKYVVHELIPAYYRGVRRRTNPEYNAIAYARDPKNLSATDKDRSEALNKMRKIPRMDIRDPGYRRSMFVRYADDFVFLLEGPKSEALNIKDIIKTFLINNVGFDYNDKKTLVSHIGEGFHFLGANVKSLRHFDFRMKTKTINGAPITMRANVRSRINMPTKQLIEKLIKSGFAGRNYKGQLLAKPITSIVNLDHATIIQFFNSKIHGLLNYYSFASNRIESQNIIWILRLSLAKTLARKLKLRSARQAFKKFGPYLKDPSTELKIYVPSCLPTIHKYNNVENITSATKIFEQSWYGRLTKTNIFKKCVICGTSSNIQMHHLRKVKDVRARMVNHRANFNVWKGATLRKQIPLCLYHHNLYHNGKLLNYELNLISKYSHNMSTDLKEDISEQQEVDTGGITH